MINEFQLPVYVVKTNRITHIFERDYILCVQISDVYGFNLHYIITSDVTGLLSIMIYFKCRLQCRRMSFFREHRASRRSRCHFHHSLSRL